MKPFLFTLCLAAVPALWLPAQQLGQLHLPEDNESLANREITVDLTEFEDPLADEPGAAVIQVRPDDATDAAGEAQAAAARPAAATGEDDESGIGVQLSGFTSSDGSLDLERVEVRAPFPPKPLATKPAGWKLLPCAEDEEVFERDVEIAPGTAVQLRIRPHLLVPDADGSRTFAVGEPGYDPALQYRQVETVGALLGDSIEQLKQDDERMAEAIHRLEQLLVSLPDPEQ